MNYWIEEKEVFYIVGIKERVFIIFYGVNLKIVVMWESLNDEIVCKLKEFFNVILLGLFSVFLNFFEGRMEEKG